jgi:hypothetical protein
MLTLPATLAHLQSERLNEVLNAELTADRLPLQRYTTHGGWPGESRLTVRAVRETGSVAEVLSTVEFVEEVPAACPASAQAETRVAYFTVRIQKSDASAEIIDD